MTTSKAPDQTSAPEQQSQALNLTGLFRFM